MCTQNDRHTEGADKNGLMIHLPKTVFFWWPTQIRPSMPDWRHTTGRKTMDNLFWASHNHYKMTHFIFRICSIWSYNIWKAARLTAIWPAWQCCAWHEISKTLYTVKYREIYSEGLISVVWICLARAWMYERVKQWQSRIKKQQSISACSYSHGVKYWRFVMPLGIWYWQTKHPLAPVKETHRSFNWLQWKAACFIIRCLEADDVYINWHIPRRWGGWMTW